MQITLINMNVQYQNIPHSSKPFQKWFLIELRTDLLFIKVFADLKVIIITLERLCRHPNRFPKFENYVFNCSHIQSML